MNRSDPPAAAGVGTAPASGVAPAALRAAPGQRPVPRPASGGSARDIRLVSAWVIAVGLIVVNLAIIVLHA